MFITPAKIASGGVSGIAIILFHTLGLETGLGIFALSVPIFLLGLRIFGKMYGFKSFLGTIFLSGFTTFLNWIIGVDGVLNYNQEVSMLLSAIFGGVMAGIGIGIVMMSGANTGGTDIVAQILAKYTPISLGRALTLVDALVIISSAFIFGIESAMYAIITVYITGIMIDKVVFGIGKNYAKTIFIISNKREEIQKAILFDLERGGTILTATGMYSGENRPVIMTVIPNNQVNALTRIVHKTDPRAFMIVSEAYNVLGEGFKPITEPLDN